MAAGIEPFAGRGAQDFENLGHLADFVVGDLVVGVDVEDEFGGRLRMPIREGHALVDLSGMAGDIEKDAEVIAWQPIGLGYSANGTRRGSGLLAVDRCR